MVKKIIRKYDYSNFEQTHKECIEMGLKVNRPALDRFGERLQQLDNKAKATLEFDDHEDTRHETIELSPDYHNGTPSGTPSGTTFQDSHTEGNKDFTQFKDRADEITYELGSLRIRENELLKELSTIKKKLSN